MRFRFQFPCSCLSSRWAPRVRSPVRPVSHGAGRRSLAEDQFAAVGHVRFGNDTVGSPFPPPSGHDQSGHGRDNLIPRTAVHRSGRTVTFVIGGPVHQVSIYKDGTAVESQPRGAAPKAGCGPRRIIPGTAIPTLLPCRQPRAAGGRPTVSYTFRSPGGTS
jgi:hypothetical protein